MGVLKYVPVVRGAGIYVSRPDVQGMMGVHRELSWTVRGRELRVDLLTFLGVLVATGIGVLGVVLSPLSGDVLRTLDVWALADPSILFLGLLVVPVAYLSVISTARFRWESLGSLVAVTGVVFGDVVALAAVLVPALVVLSSYKARSVFNGKNYFWTYFSTGGTLIVVLSLFLAAGTGYMVYTDTAVQQQMKDAATERAVELGTVLVEQQLDDELPGLDDGLNGVGEELPDEVNPTVLAQLQQVTDLVAQQLAAEAVHEAQEQLLTVIDEGGFDGDQRQFLLERFDEARDPMIAEGEQHADDIAQRYLADHEGDSIDEELLVQAAEAEAEGIGVSVTDAARNGVMEPALDSGLFTAEEEEQLITGFNGMESVTADAVSSSAEGSVGAVMSQVDGEDGSPLTEDGMIEEQIAAMVDEPVEEAFAHPEHVAAALFFLVFATVRLLKLPVSIVTGILGWIMHLVGRGMNRS